MSASQSIENIQEGSLAHLQVVLQSGPHLLKGVKDQGMRSIGKKLIKGNITEKVKKVIITRKGDTPAQNQVTEIDGIGMKEINIVHHQSIKGAILKQNLLREKMKRRFLIVMERKLFL